MQIKRIEVSALKGYKFISTFGPATIIVGPNDTGKTARLDAVRLLLFGRLPGRKTGPAIFELSSATTMKIEGEIVHEGRHVSTVTRSWTKKAGAVKSQESGTEDLPRLPEVLLDANEYFGAGPTRRIEMVFELCDVGALKPISALEKIIEPAGLKIDANGLTVQQWLEVAMHDLNDAATRARAEVKRFQGMTQGITAVSLEEKTVDPAAIERAIAEQRDALEKAIAEHARLNAVAEQVTAKSRRKRELRERMAETDRSIGVFVAPDELTVNGLEDRLAQMQGTMANAKATYAAEIKAWEKAAAKASRLEAIEEKIALHKKIADSGEEAQRRRDEIESAIKALGPTELVKTQRRCQECAVRVAEVAQQQRAVEAERKAELERLHRLSVQKCCPTCGATGKEWADMLEAVVNEKQVVWEEQEVRIGEAYAAATEDQKAAEAAHSVEVLKQAELERLERSLAAERQRQRDAHAAGVLVEQLTMEKDGIGPVQTTKPEPPPELAQIEAEWIAGKEIIAKLQAIDRRRGYEEEMEAIGTLDDEAGEAAARAELEIEGLRDGLQAAEEAKAQAAAQLADAKRLQQAADERAAAEERLARIDAAKKALAKERDQLIERAFTPLLETANRFIVGMIPSPLEFHDGGIGRFQGSSWVDLSAFGGTFQAAAYAGIQAALCMKSPARIVIVDELGRMDATHKAKFIGNVIDALHAGVIDQFIGVDVTPEDWEPGPPHDALTIITTGSK